MTIGENIKRRRNELGITLVGLGELIGVREATIQRYESGNIKNIKHQTIVSLAKALKTTPESLMGWDSEKSTENDFYFTDEEKRIIKYYRALDERGRQVVTTILISEYKHVGM